MTLATYMLELEVHKDNKPNTNNGVEKTFQVKSWKVKSKLEDRYTNYHRFDGTILRTANRFNITSDYEIKETVSTTICKRLPTKNTGLVELVLNLFNPKTIQLKMEWGHWENIYNYDPKDNNYEFSCLTRKYEGE